MSRIQVISAGQPTLAPHRSSFENRPGDGSDGAATKNDDDDDDAAAAASDSIDRHNRPRTRRDVILSSLRAKYADGASFVTISSTSFSRIDLIYLYSRVHDVGMVRFLVESWDKWKGMGPPWDEDNCHPDWREGSGIVVPPLVPLHSAFRRDGIERPSNNVMGAIGYYCTDLLTPIVGTLVRELSEDAIAICTAVECAFPRSIEKYSATTAYAVTTHPGHHASYDCFGGYCYLNNAALCARLMQRRIETGKSIVGDDGVVVVAGYWNDDDDDVKDDDEVRRGRGGGSPSTTTTTNVDKSRGRARVAIIDVDYHCGNGTASIFYDDPHVFVVSIHCDPEIDYPWNSGYADQTGGGDGVGTTLHVPLPPGAGWDDVYASSLSDAMLAITKFEPSALVVSLGLDTHDGDAVAVNRGGFTLSGRDYYEMGRLMGSYMSGKDVPCVFVQEGGYKMDVVGDAAADVVGGYAAGVGGEVV
ncbi:hypothetical protein ACHAXA_009241 [Cyclostephanos tholiformis]|uniref:Histone deacetylase domain-containing protein n=1 Tax=Cyclostephanos tholiformis TaxID=382380 RepID=A0ABD3R9P6_9STRA